MQNPLPERLSAMIALFEGSSGGRINVWDEQLLSLGAFHFAVGQGSGAQFLIRMAQLDPAGVQRCLGAPFLAAIRGGVRSVTAYCRTHVWKSGTRWNRAFADLSRLPAYAQAEAELGKPYHDAARVIAQRYGLTSERGLAFALDRCVQQGGRARPQVDNVYTKVKGKAEWEVMQALALAYANTANPKYVGTVKARALTVAYGSSANSGYPGRVHLQNDFGIRGDVPWNVAVADAPTVFVREPGRHGATVEWGFQVKGAKYGGIPLTPARMIQLRAQVPRGGAIQVADAWVEHFTDGALKLTRMADKQYLS